MDSGIRLSCARLTVSIPPCDRLLPMFEVVLHIDDMALIRPLPRVANSMEQKSYISRNSTYGSA
jgi:hypothetical protein